MLSGLLAKHRPAIQEKISQAFGETATFDRLGVSWSSLGLSARNLRIADDPRFAATPFIHSAELRVRLRWLSLIRGRIEIERLILLQPEIQIIRNEATSLNILARKRPEGHPPSTYSRAALKVTDGRIEYIDRAAREPVEIQIQDLDMELAAPKDDGRRSVKLAATVFHPGGNAQNVRLQGWVGGGQTQDHWTQTPLDLRVRADTLLLGHLMRAVPVLREQVVEMLDVTGPITLAARLRGTVKRPHVTQLLLRGPFFGSSRTNLKLTGNLDLTHGKELTDGYFKGDLTLNPVGYDRLKKLPLLRDMLPDSLAANGPLGVVAGFEGTLAMLKVRANVQARRSEISYGDWVKKPKGTPGSMELAMVFLDDKAIFEDSLVSLHNLRLRFSGSIDSPPEGRVFLRLHTEGVELSGWEKIIPSLARTQLRGKSRFGLAVTKSLSGSGSDAEIWGDLHLNDVEVKHATSRRKSLVDKVSGQVSFAGKEARLRNFSLDFGSSSVSLEGVLQNYEAPVLRYSVRSEKLKLSDLDRLPGKESDWLQRVRGTGEMRQDGDGIAVLGQLSSPAGVLQGAPYRELSADLEWSRNTLDVRRFTLQALGGTIAGSGLLRAQGDKTSFTLRPSAKNLDINDLLRREIAAPFPEIEGKLDLEADITGQGKSWSDAWRAMQGSGRVDIRGGVIRNFNFAENVLSNVSGLPGIGKLTSTRPSAVSDPAAQRGDTPFQALGSSFTIAEGKIDAKDVVLTSPEFEIRGDGTVGPARSLKAAATLVMSRDFSREVAEEHPNTRFLLDPGGRLVIPFRIEGSSQRPQVRPDLRRLAESIQNGLLGRSTADRPDQRRRRR